MPGTITIKNISEGEAIYRYEVVIGNGSIDVVALEIPNEEKLNSATILFGFGQLWTNKRIREYVGTINFIEIVSPSDSIRLTDKNEMIKFFEDRRSGLFKNEVKVTIR